ncbi:hypothetical protein BgAZ_104130 [Babesia gibsoni]|uniref:Uncharacterized protein n=1 Tax=Babesia gibsoni TaxID=33632 RepID=A0AAD8UU02_BABGI|nr:hypothetical protein BgAZ_104130 [Babesia gibsoni]
MSYSCLHVSANRFTMHIQVNLPMHGLIRNYGHLRRCIYHQQRAVWPKFSKTITSGAVTDSVNAFSGESRDSTYKRRCQCPFSTLRVNTGSDSTLSPNKDTTPGTSKGEESSLQEKRDANIVLRQPIPKNFIKETFLPHLEHNVAYNAHKFPPSVVLQIAIAYSKLPAFIRQRAIEDSIIETFIDRMVDYTATDCVQVMNTSLQLQGLRNIKVYNEIIKRLKDKHVFGSITVLNRLGIVRCISRILQRAHVIQECDSASVPLDVEVLDLKQYRSSIMKPWTLITSNIRNSELKKFCSELVTFGGDSLLPQLEFEMQSMDSYELSDLLGVFAERAERDSAKLDFPIIAILMQRIIAINDDTPMVNKLANICSLCRLRVSHSDYLDMVISEIHDPLKVNNIFHRHLARAIWSFSRLQALDRVFDALIPHIERNALHFEPSSVARLSQLYNAEMSIGKFCKTKLERLCDVLVKNALHSLNRIDKFTPKELVFFYTSLCYLKLIPVRSDFESFLNSRSTGSLAYIESSSQVLESQLKAKGKTRTHFLESVISAMERLENDFDLSEIKRVVSVSESMEHANYVLDHLPGSWSRVVKESGDDLV